MPILIDSTPFIDTFGNVTPFYVSNAGDKMEMRFNLRSSIRMTSVANPLTLDPSVNQVQSASIGWLDEGFRVGDVILIYIHSSGGAIINTFWSQLVYVDNVMADFGGMPDWYDITAGEFVTMYSVVGPFTGTYTTNSYQTIARDDLDLLFGHQKNSNPGSEFSLIDGEVTRVQFQGVAALTVGGIVGGLIVGNQSGEFLISGELERNADTSDGWFMHQVRIVFVNSGLYDNGTWFFSSECLKIYAKLLWARLAGEPFARAESIYNLEANTGEYNEPHNSSVNDAVLVSGFSELDYCVPTDFTIVVDGPLVAIGLGAAYRSIDDNYYRNQVQSQTAFTMLTPTTIINNFFVPVNSEQNPSGAGYSIELNNLTQVGTITTIEATFTPNAAFVAFFTNVDDGDRLFKLWVKCGNLNLLAFDNQLTCDPPVGGPLIMFQDYGYLDHFQNVDTLAPSAGDLTGFIADTEDDAGYIGKFLMDKSVIYESFTVKMEAFNTVTLEDFTLAIVTFSFAGVQISGAGVYLLNETQGVNLELPTTSLKRDARLTLYPSIDTPTQFGVEIYAPWLLNWRYWLQQLNASVDFYPTQNKNWEQYDNLTNWQLRTELSLIKDGLAYTHDNAIVDLEYNAESLIDSTIELILDATAQVVNVIPIGNLMRIKSTHVNLVGPWNQPNVWGMITIEAFESSPRWICSSCVNFDNNTSNPLTPLSGLLINIVFPALNVAVLECYFDPGQINLSNGVKITAKIKETDAPIVQTHKTTSPSDVQKTDTFTNDKTLAP